jgi:hypothetical protein
MAQRSAQALNRFGSGVMDLEVHNQVCHGSAPPSLQFAAAS